MKAIKAIWNAFVVFLYGLLIVRRMVSLLFLGGLALICLSSVVSSWLGGVGVEFSPAATSIRVVRPTRTQNLARPATSTPRPNLITVTPRDNPGCKSTENMSLTDVGETMCVYGEIASVGKDEVAQYINFVDTNFQVITYDPTAILPFESGDCVRFVGDVDRLGSHPIMIVNIGDSYSFCGN